MHVMTTASIAIRSAKPEDSGHLADVPAPGFGQRFSTTVDVQIDEAIQAGDAIPIATSGFFDSEFEAEFVPLDGQSKLQSLIDSLPGQAAAD